jgi:DNA mismatch repair protein MutL
MPNIAALPQATVRLLGSPVVITTPISLVKELVENAIDAKATIIEVIISSNTVNIIEVRDNGVGIPTHDFEFIGRRGHTSKLGSFKEINTIGGKSLGFRGEALASCSTLGAVTIITRTQDEAVAARLHLDEQRGVVSKEPVSAPVGTTVRVCDLFSRLPVRAQVTVKEAPKIQAKLKSLLQSYALARPQIKFSFKVLGRPTLGWSAASSQTLSMRDTISRVLSRDLASQCLEWPTPGSTTERLPLTQHGIADYKIEAFLPRPDADLSKISKGVFFSVDSRPVSPSRGALKKLNSMFRAYFNKAAAVNDAKRYLGDPFTRVNIRCTPGSYDPSVEAAKNEVLFVNEQHLIQKFRAVLEEVYPSKREQTFRLQVPDEVVCSVTEEPVSPDVSSKLCIPPLSHKEGVNHQVSRSSSAIEISLP